MNYNHSIKSILNQLPKINQIILSSVYTKELQNYYFPTLFIRSKNISFPLILGLSLCYPNKEIICFQDANDFMNSLDSCIILKEKNISNIVLFAFNDGLDLNLKKTALNLGFKYAYQINKINSMEPVMNWINEKNNGSRFIELNVMKEELEEIPNNINPYENCKKFMENLNF